MYQRFPILKAALFLFFAGGSLAASATTRRVLFIGNSFTYTNNMPLMLQQMAAAMGDTLIYDQNTPGGYTFQDHSSDAVTISKIFSQQWDIVVLQEQSQRPAFPPAQVATDTYPYAHKLDSMVRKNDSCTQTMFLVTWGYRNGDASNCAFYPPICTYAGMQASLRASYLQMSADNAGITTPVGMAWKTVRDSFPSLDLYSPDDMHPGLAGSYQEACVLYASIFQRNPAGVNYTGGVNTTDAQKLQTIAGRTVFDSLSQWNMHGHYPYAAFTKAYSGSTVNFQNQSLNAGVYQWDFGDGNTSGAVSPAHLYSTPGTYTVKLTAGTCLHSVKADTVHIQGTGILSTEQEGIAVSFSMCGNGQFGLSWNTSLYSSLVIFSADGRKVKEYNLQAGQKYISDLLSPGLYIYRFSGKEHHAFTGKMMIQ
ncbi:DUF4886 domain-containing protein [Chitinophagaceae bacterium MMS25-I14]